MKLSDKPRFIAIEEYGSKGSLNLKLYCAYGLHLVGVRMDLVLNLCTANENMGVLYVEFLYVMFYRYIKYHEKRSAITIPVPIRGIVDATHNNDLPTILAQFNNHADKGWPIAAPGFYEAVSITSDRQRSSMVMNSLCSDADGNREGNVRFDNTTSMRIPMQLGTLRLSYEVRIGNGRCFLFFKPTRKSESKLV